MTPKRIQRKRTMGWKMPPDTIYVGRPTKWGNPFEIGMVIRESDTNDYITTLKNIEDVLMWYKNYLRRNGMREEIINELRGKNLSCWCAPGSPCHADILLKIANG